MSEEALLEARAKDADLKSAFAALSKDYGNQTARIRNLSHSIVCTCSGVTLRLHFPAFRQSKPTLSELVDAIAVYLVHFALPRSEVEALTALYKTIDPHEFMKRYSLHARARSTIFSMRDWEWRMSPIDVAP